MNKHNPIDVDGDSLIEDTPFYAWLRTNQSQGHTYSSLIIALQWYLGLKPGKDFITNQQHWCYKCILNTFVEREVLV